MIEMGNTSPTRRTSPRDASNQPQPRGAVTRAALVAAAVELIEEKGEAGLRLADVSQRAGVSTPGIYHYFTNRDELVEAARVEQYSETLASDALNMANVIENAHDSDEMVEMMRDVTEEVSASDQAERRWRRAAILGAARRRPELAAQLAQRQHEVNVELERIARLGQERGLLDPSLDPKALGIFVQAFNFGLLLADIDGALGLGAKQWLDVVTRFVAAVTPASGNPSTPATPAD